MSTHNIPLHVPIRKRKSKLIPNTIMSAGICFVLFCFVHNGCKNEFEIAVVNGHQCSSHVSFNPYIIWSTNALFRLQ